MAGANAHQNVSDQIYESFLNKTKTELLVQRSDYYINKLKRKKYLIIENDEKPEKPKARFLIQSINEETGLLVPTRDPPSLAEAILRIYKDRELGARLGQRGYEFVRQRFSTEVMADKIVGLYDRLAAEKGIDLYKE